MKAEINQLVNEQDFYIQVEEHDVDDLDLTISVLMVPLLKEFSKNIYSYPENLSSRLLVFGLDVEDSMEGFECVIELIKRAFELNIEQKLYRFLSEKEDKELNLGLKLFSEFFTDLWR